MGARVKVEEVKPHDDTQQPVVNSSKSPLWAVDSKDKLVNKKRKNKHGQDEMGFGSKIMLMIM